MEDPAVLRPGDVVRSLKPGDVEDPGVLRLLCWLPPSTTAVAGALAASRFSSTDLVYRCSSSESLDQLSSAAAAPWCASLSYALQPVQYSKLREYSMRRMGRVTHNNTN